MLRSAAIHHKNTSSWLLRIFVKNFQVSRNLNLVSSVRQILFRRIRIRREKYSWQSRWSGSENKAERTDRKMDEHPRLHRCATCTGESWRFYESTCTIPKSLKRGTERERERERGEEIRGPDRRDACAYASGLKSSRTRSIHSKREKTAKRFV